MFNSLRKSIANFIAPSNVGIAKNFTPKVTVLPYMGKGMHKDEGRSSAPVAHHAPTPLFGDLTIDQISTLSSDRVKSSIIQFGAWIALSSAFNIYVSLQGRKPLTVTKDIERRKIERDARQAAQAAQNIDYRTPVETLEDKFLNAANAFHQWNSRLEASGSGLDILEIALRLCVPRAARQNEQTDMILARIKGIKVEEVTAQRAALAEKRAKQKEALVEAFVAELEGYAFGDAGNPTIRAAQALAKAEEVLLWIASWDNPDVAELLIAEQDIAVLKKLAHDAELKQGAGEGSRELDEMLLDAGGMRQGSGK